MCEWDYLASIVSAVREWNVAWLLVCCLEDAHLPLDVGGCKHDQIVLVNQLCNQNLVLPQDLFLILHVVYHLDREAFRGVEQYLDVMSAILVACMESASALRGDSFREAVSGGTDKGGIEVC